MTTAFTLHRLLSRIVLAASSIFAWVLVFDLKLALAASLPIAFAETALLFALSQIIVLLLAPATAQLYGRGMVRLMLFGTLALAAAYTVLGAAILGYYVPYCVSAFALLAGASRALYATPFSLIQHDMGRDSYAHEFLYSLIPLAAAYALAQGPLSQALVLAVGAAMLACAALFLVRFEAFESFSWNYRETFGMLLEPAHRQFTIEHLLKGYEGAALFFAWPIFVYLILGHAYLPLGVVMTASLLGLMVVRLVLPQHDEGTPLFAATLAGGVWLLRIVAAGPVAVVLLQLAGTAGAPHRIRALQSGNFAADADTFLDEVSVLKEISLALGRTIFALAFVAVNILLTPFWALGLTFATAAAAAALGTYRSLSHQ